jgi:hypothetical protein
MVNPQVPKLSAFEVQELDEARDNYLIAIDILMDLEEF